MLETARLLAESCREAGELAEARRILEDALAAGHVALPEDDPLILLLTHDLGLVADEFGNRHEARRNLATVAGLGPTSLGADHPAVTSAASYLARDDASAPTVGPPAARHFPPPPDQRLPRPAPLAARSPGPSPRQRRTTMVTAVAAVAVVAALTTAMIVNAAPGPPVQTAPAGPTAGSPTGPDRDSTRPGPTEVRLRDDGTSITLSWHDPTGGTMPFIVAGARAGEQSRPFANLPAGRTTFTLNGLNPRLEYCFTVVAVYSTDSFTASGLVCTRRSAGGLGTTRP